MQRRTYLGTLAGVAATAALSGCLQGDAVLHHSQISATSPTKEWEIELTADSQYRLEVDKTDSGAGSVTGYVHHAETGEEVVSTGGGTGHEEFEVSETATYVVSIEVGGSTGEIIVRDMNE
jgi:hypothetical protein